MSFTVYSDTKTVVETHVVNSNNLNVGQQQNAILKLAEGIFAVGNIKFIYLAI